jgi:hypothetical protein
MKDGSQTKCFESQTGKNFDTKQQAHYSVPALGNEMLAVLNLKTTQSLHNSSIQLVFTGVKIVHVWFHQNISYFT